jgi:hypothetical protein
MCLTTIILYPGFRSQTRKLRAFSFFHLTHVLGGVTIFKLFGLGFGFELGKGLGLRLVL